jgi:hypothetical protein
MIGMSFSIQSADFEERQLTNGNFLSFRIWRATNILLQDLE